MIAYELHSPLSFSLNLQCVNADDKMPEFADENLPDFVQE